LEPVVAADACPVLPQTSYWLVLPNETGGVNNLLIIVNSVPRWPVFVLVDAADRRENMSKKWQSGGVGLRSDKGALTAQVDG
jgi:hypothetical protein